MSRFDYNGGGGGGSSSSEEEVVLPSTAEGRLSLDSADPSPENVSGATTLYYLPYTGRQVAIYDGISAWSLFDIGASGISLSNGALSSGTVYDVFAYSNLGSAALEVTAWTDGTNRATGLVRQDGVLVRAGGAGHSNRRYLGTIRTDSSSEFNDSDSQRLVWNAQNRTKRSLRIPVYTNSHGYSAGTLRPMDNDTSLRVEVVRGDDSSEPVSLGFEASGQSNAAGSLSSGFGLDSTSALAADQTVGYMEPSAAYRVESFSGHYEGHPGLGYHYLQWLQASNEATITWRASGAGGCVGHCFA